MTVKIKVWSDFVCPFCMIAEKPLLEAVKASGVEVAIEWMPFELRPYPTPTLRPEDSYLPAIWAQAVYPLADKYGITMKLPSVSPQPHTALAWEGYQFAREQGKAHEYNERMLQAFFQEDQDIGDTGTLARLAADVGLDQADIKQALNQRTYRDAHLQALEQAKAAGVQAVPTITVGGYQLSGVQSKETLIHAIRSAAVERTGQ